MITEVIVESLYKKMDRKKRRKNNFEFFYLKNYSRNNASNTS